MGEGGCNTGEVGLTVAQTCVAEREEVDDASKARREGQTERTQLISQDCEAKTASKEAQRVINRATSRLTVV